MVLDTRADAVTRGMTHVLEVASGARTTGTATIEGAPITKYALDLDVRLVQLPETVLVTRHESFASMGITLASATATESNRATAKFAPAVHAIADEVLGALKAPSTPSRPRR